MRQTRPRLRSARLGALGLGLGLGLGIAASACFLTLSFDYETSADRDGGLDGEAVAHGFALRADPSVLTTRQGGSARLHVIVDRQPGFTTAVAVGVASPPADVTVGSLALDGATGDGFLDVAVGAAPPGRLDLEVVASSSSDNAAHLHVTIDVTPAGGGFDPGFGDGGVVILAPVGLSGSVESVSVQPDGKIVVAGYTELDGGEQGIVLRLTETGAVDRAFADGGRSFTAGAARALSVLPDGRLLVGTSDKNGKLTITRLRPDGSVDQTYGTAGSYVSASSSDECVGIARSGDRALASCRHQPSFFGAPNVRVTQLTTEGIGDATWGKPDAGGNVDVAPTGAPAALAATSAGQVVVAVAYTKVPPGAFNAVPTSNLTLVRLAADGSRDPTFGDGGAWDVTFPTTSGGYAIVHRIVLDEAAALASFFLVGEAADEPEDPHPAASLRMVLARIGAAGKPDPAFGAAGFLKLSGLPTSWANDAVLLVDGTILLAGARMDPRGLNAAVVHVLGDGNVDPSFWSPSSPPKTGVAATLGAASEARALAVQPDGRVIVAGYAREPTPDGGAGAARMFVLRLVP